MNRSTLYAIAGVVVVLIGAGIFWYQKKTAELDPFVVQIGGDPQEVAAYESLVRTFHNENPDIEMELVKLTELDDPVATLEAQFSIGNPPDVFLIDQGDYAQFAGQIRPTGGLLGEGIEDYHDPTVEAFSLNGELQCVPQDISSPVVYYNTKFFKEMLLGEPTSWNWDQFRQAALDVTNLGVDGVGIQPSLFQFSPFIWSNGGEIVDDQKNPTRLTLDEEKSREALEYLLTLRDFKLIPTQDEIEKEDVVSRFAAGKVGMLISPRNDGAIFRGTEGLEWDVAPLPVATDPASTFRTNGYCMSKGSTHQEEAEAFIRYVAGTEGQTVASSTGAIVPASEAVSRSETFLDPELPPSHANVFLDAIAVVRRDPTIPNWEEIEDITDQILIRMFYEPDFTIDDALAEIQVQTAPLFPGAVATSPAPAGSAPEVTQPPPTPAATQPPVTTPPAPQPTATTPG